MGIRVGIHGVGLIGRSPRFSAPSIRVTAGNFVTPSAWNGNEGGFPNRPGAVARFVVGQL